MNDDLRTHGLWQTTATPSPATTTLQDHVDADVIVIGAGFTGLSTALHLSERGTSVVVIEAVEIGFGGSGRNVGLVNAGMWVKPEVVKATLGRVFGERLLTLLGDAPRLVFDLIKTHGIDCEARHAGTLHCGVGPQGLTEIEERASQWVAHGAPVRVLDAEETTARTGARGFSGALFDPRAGTVQPLGYVRGLARAAMK